MQRDMQVLELVQLLGLVWVQPRWHGFTLCELVADAALLSGWEEGEAVYRCKDEDIMAGLRQMMEDDVCVK